MIISFYSFKGGVGRTQLVANLAAYLCHHKKRKILLIDWDIEAPGLDYFFNVDRAKISKGIIDLFEDYSKIISRKENRLDISDLPLITNDYFISLVSNIGDGGGIDLLAAGKYNSEYSKKISDFDWFKFYETYNGKYYLENLKEQLSNLDYDYIFIDSRTGLNDYSGICNIQMPDLNVIIAAPSKQNFDGCLYVIKNITTSPYVKNGSREPIIMPILSRLDRTDDESGKWFAIFRKRFNKCILNFAVYANLGQEIPMNSQNKVVDEYIENTLMPYKSKISYGEKLLFSKNIKSIEYTTLEKQFEEIAKLIEDIARKDKKSVFIGDNVYASNILVAGDVNVIQSNINVAQDKASEIYIDNIVATLKIFNEDIQDEVKDTEDIKKINFELNKLIGELGRLEKQGNLELHEIKLPMKRLSFFLEDIHDSSSETNRIVTTIKRGTQYAKEIARLYNSVAQLIGLPLVPEFLLKRK